MSGWRSPPSRRRARPARPSGPPRRRWRVSARRPCTGPACSPPSAGRGARPRSSAEVVAALSGATRPADVVDVVLGQARALGATGCAVVLQPRRPARGGRRATGRVARCPRPPPTTTRSPAPSARRDPQWTSERRSPCRCRCRTGRSAPSSCGSPTAARLRRRTSAPRCSRSPGSARRRWTGPGCTRPSTTSRTSCSAACSRPACRRWPGSPAPPATPGDGARASGGDWYDLLQIDETGSRSSSATSSGTGRRPRPSWASCAARWRRTCSTATRPRRRWSGSTGSPPGRRGRRQHLRLPGRRLVDRCAVLGAGRASAGAAGRRGGHPLPRRRDRGAPGRGHGAVLGVRGRPPYAEGSTTVKPGSSIVLYTDGLVERRGEVLDTGQERLADAARGRRTWAPPSWWRRSPTPRSATPGRPTTSRCWWCAPFPRRSKGRLPARGESMRVLRRAMAGWEAAAGLSRRARRGPGARARRGRGERRRARLRRPRGRGVRVLGGPARRRRPRGVGARPRPLAAGAAGQRAPRPRAAGHRPDRRGPAHRPR